MSSTASRAVRTVKSLVPARLDRLPWARFHWMVVVGLGVSWILDGLEIQIVSQNGFQPRVRHVERRGRRDRHGLPGRRRWSVRWSSAGSPTGSADASSSSSPCSSTWRQRPGRPVLPNFAVPVWVFRFIAGVGIGGEYSAINSAIDELIPSHYRGRVDIAINGTYWGGAALGAAANLYLLNPDVGRRVNIGLADRLLHRPGDRSGHHLPAPAHPGEPALADHPRPRGRGERDRRRDRGASPRRRATSSAEVDESKAIEIVAAGADAVPQAGAGLLRDVPEAHGRRRSR